MTGTQITQYEWDEPWRRRGDCYWCGVYSVLTASCERCKKWSCGTEACVKVIMYMRHCAVPAVSI